MMEGLQPGRRLAKVWTLLKNSLVAIVKGQFLLRLNVGRYFIHVIFTFFVLGAVIWASLQIDTTLAKVEKNKETLKEMEILYSEKAFDVATLGRRTTISEMLRTMGSSVTEPEKPAKTVKK